MATQIATAPTAAPVDERDEMVSEGMVTVEAARQFLGVSRSTIYALMDAGQLAYVKFGRSRRVPRRALRAFASGNLVSCG
jgi:excisionase family DNA binding protein